MIKQTFDKLYSATQEAIHAAKQPIVLGRNERAVKSAISSAEEMQINAEEALEKELAVVTTGGTIDVNNVLHQRQVIKDAQATIDELNEFYKEFFTPTV